MSDLLQSFQCAQCGGGPLTDNDNGTVTCPYCNAVFAHPDRVCPRCQTVNETDARECVSCGERLQEPCVRCGTLNVVSARHCRRCGAALSILEHIAERRAQSDAERILSLQAEAPHIKEETERASQERLGKMWAQENARLTALAKSKAEQQRQERLLLAIAVTAMILVAFVIVALTIVSQMRR
jgi:ribosomal protein L40E